MPTMVAETARSKENRTPGVWTRLLHRPLALIGLAVIIVVVGAAALAPWVVPYDPHEQFFEGLTIEGAPLPPNSQFWLGTDLVGRDLLSRLIYGARTDRKSVV